jgi:hypothetical protein
MVRWRICEMIEAKDLEAIQKICEELKELGYTEPRVTIFRAFNEESEIIISISKSVLQTPKEDI